MPLSQILRSKAVLTVLRSRQLALTATPRKVHQWLQCEVSQIEIDKERLVQFETKQIIGYNSLKTIINKTSKYEVGLCYTRQIRKMKEIEAMAIEAELSPICVWSINNKKCL